MESLDSVRLSVRTRNQLSTLKRRTGIQNWNVLCRWAFCLSLAEPTTPRPPEKGEVGVELAWHTFGGADSEIYLALAKQRCQTEGQELERANLNRLVRSHIERGVGYLVARANNVSALIQLCDTSGPQFNSESISELQQVRMLKSREGSKMGEGRRCQRRHKT